MRIELELDDDLVASMDEVAGPGGGSDFVRRAIEQAVRQAQQWASLDSAAGVIDDSGHAWDRDSAGWVRDQRRGDQQSARRGA